jgi:hypothetical protein
MTTALPHGTTFTGRYLLSSTKHLRQQQQQKEQQQQKQKVARSNPNNLSCSVNCQCHRYYSCCLAHATLGVGFKAWWHARATGCPHTKPMLSHEQLDELTLLI